jgi:Flp pilus assembly pilin Flp
MRMFLPDAAGGTAIQYCLIAVSLSALVMVLVTGLL